MTVAGIIAEYNPFHTGHARQIEETRRRLGEEMAVAAVMSGNWVQQAGCAIADKWTRARLALLGGADLVLELPTVWAVSSAETFARGAVSILDAAGVVDVLSFGSECGDVEALREAAACLDSEAYRVELGRFLKEGLSFAAARQKAVQELLGYKAELLSGPNNNLGIEYIRAINDRKSGIRPITVHRRGAAHNSLSGEAPPQFVSATQLRLDIERGNWERAEPYLVSGGRSLLEGAAEDLPSLKRVERAMLSRVRTMTAADWSLLPDAGAEEGLARRLEQAGRQAVSMEEFFRRAKTKRYSHARLRRLSLWAYLGLTGEDRPKAPPYLRVLGFNDRGREVLREMKLRAALPILTKPAHAKQLGGPGGRLFEKEVRCTDLYDLCFSTVRVPGREWTSGPIRIAGQER